MKTILSLLLLALFGTTVRAYEIRTLLAINGDHGTGLEVVLATCHPLRDENNKQSDDDSCMKIPYNTWFALVRRGNMYNLYMLQTPYNDQKNG